MEPVQSKQSILTGVRALILDMDGVLWRGKEPIGSTPAIFARIRSLGLRVVMATNNATRSVPQYLEFIRSLGVELEPWQIVNSAQATARYLQIRFPEGGSVYVVGEDGLVETLAEAGFQFSDRDPLAVIVAMDRGFSYEKLRIATKWIREGALFIASNPDPTFPAPEGIIPGAGSIVAAVETASGVQPVIIGKPSPEMYILALERLGLPAEQALVVGDRLATDIAGAQQIGCPTALVLSGVTNLAEAQAWAQPPDLIAKDLSSVLEKLAETITEC